MSPISVADMMTREVYAVAPDTDLDTVAWLLTEHRISGLPVVGADGSPLGVLSRADLVPLARPDRPAAAGRSIYYRIRGGSIGTVGTPVAAPPGRRGTARELMSSRFLAVAPSARLGEAARLMVNGGVHRLLVVDEGRLVGILATLDVLRAVSDRAGGDEGRAS